MGDIWNNSASSVSSYAFKQTTYTVFPPFERQTFETLLSWFFKIFKEEISICIGESSPSMTSSSFQCIKTLDFYSVKGRIEIFLLTRKIEKRMFGIFLNESKGITRGWYRVSWSISNNLNFLVDWERVDKSFLLMVHYRLRGRVKCWGPL